MIATYREENDTAALACAQRQSHPDTRKYLLDNRGREETGTPTLGLSPELTHLDISELLEGIHAMVEREAEEEGQRQEDEQ